MKICSANSLRFNKLLGVFLIVMFVMSISHPVWADEAKDSTNWASVANHAVDKAGIALADITQKLSTAAPKAWSVVIQGVKYQAAAHLIMGGIALVWCLIGWLICMYNVKRVKNCNDGLHICFALFAGFSAVISGLVFAYHIMDAQVWAAYLNPEGYLALQILQKAF